MSLKASEIKQLYRKRNITEKRFEHFIKFVDSIRETPLNEFSQEQISELELNLERASNVLLEFDEVQLTIEMNCHNDVLDAENEHRCEIEKRFSQKLAVLKSILKQLSQLEIKEDRPVVEQPNLPANDVSQNFSGLEGIKLPPIKLPVFNGDYLKWIEFKDTFEALIHKNKLLTEMHKYHYLRSSLNEDALKIIQSLEFSAQNYLNAWQTLCNRFDNSRMLVNNHMKALFEINSVCKDSASALRNLIDNVKKHLGALKTLKLPTDSWDAIMIHLVTGKLDKTTALEWEKTKNDSDSSLPKLDDLFEFLKNRANFLETLELNFASTSKFSFSKPEKRYTKPLLVNHTTTRSCNFCKNDHMIYSCEKFLKLSIPERWEQIKQLKLCCNCLCTGHMGKQCQKFGCKICKKKHSSLLHENKSQEISDVSEMSNDSVRQPLHTNSVNSLLGHLSNDSKEEVLSLTNKTDLQNDFVILSTAKIKVYDKCGNSHIARIMLDSGSQCCFISENFCNILGVDIMTTETSCVSGINDLSSPINKKCKIKIGSRINEFSTKLDCFVVPKVTQNYPAYSFNVSQWKIPPGIILADDSYNVSDKIDILSDATLFWDVLSGRLDFGKNLPSLQNTVFGYIATGKILCFPKNFTCHLSIQSSQNNFDSDELQKFWLVEEPEHKILRSESNTICEDHFQKTVTRAKNGQFIVQVPWKDYRDLGDSKPLATKRLLNLEARFKRNPDFKEQYFNFIEEYENLGHMSLDSNLDIKKPFYFLPHHGVVRNDHLTTKLRVVFDGSAPSSNGKSLNDIQYPGPAIQNDIMNILIRFRQHFVGVISDINKMYRMVLMHPDDRPMQKILWRKDASQPISMYSLNTVTYGTASAPFLAMRCIQQLANEHNKKFPEACKIILRDFYVDDLITGFSCENEAIGLCNEINEILRTAGFNLRKWSSNTQAVLNNFKNESDSLSVLNLGDDSVKTLGVQWSCKQDFFTYHVEINNFSPTVTKRSMLSAIAKIYDPLGLVSCCIILVKIMIQSLWSLKLDWDSDVPSNLCSKWKQFQAKVVALNDLKIPRFVLSNNPKSIELHGFSDSSMQAYSATVYVRCIDSDGHIHVKLLCAKTKVAPVKILTIPRLELCGSLLLVQLMKTVTQSVTFKFTAFYWCDSQIVLHWLHTDPANLQVFVGNRVAEIQRNTNIENWNYVDTAENPADIGSRGILPDQLKDCKLWFEGPQFLFTEFEKPKFRDLPPILEIQELRKNVKAMISVKNDLFNVFKKFSSLNKLVRVFAHCLRFISNLKVCFEDRKFNSITATEYDNAEHVLIKLAQRESFATAISLLKGNKPLPGSNRLLSLTPFLDENELLRVGGRLKHSSLRYGEKHPLLLDKGHELSRLILDHEHKQLQHAGPQLLLASVRQKFWIISGMSLAKLVVKKCIKCFRFKPKPVIPIMADLPEQRVKVSQPFSITGVDYAGPFVLKDRKGRGCKTYKAYICLFICFSTKAVHLELISSLTTESFLAGLRRFVSRRGKPVHIYSDNGSNFVGAQKELKILFDCLSKAQNEIVNSCSNQNISWHFIPPNTPNFGGLWESNIKGVKYHLYRVIGETILVYEEFVTFLVQVEATLNSRPLHALSSDPNDYIPLTPSHFLIGKPLNTIPDPLIQESIKINQLSRFQLIQQMLQGFWKQWSKLYLNQLQQRRKWKTTQSEIKIWTLVLLKNDNLPPCKWNLGRIIAVHPGDDNVVRVVTIKTAYGTYKRGVSKCCPLPMADTVF